MVYVPVLFRLPFIVDNSHLLCVMRSIGLRSGRIYSIARTEIEENHPPSIPVKRLEHYRFNRQYCRPLLPIMNARPAPLVVS